MNEVQFNPLGKKVRVPIRHTIDRFIEIHLEDGTVLNFKPTITHVDRFVDQWDNEGNPIYAVANGPNVVSIFQIAGDLKKKS